MWKKEVNLIKLGEDQVDHNKLRFYRNIKASFTLEPYIQLVRNRNQRAWLTRLRTSTHTLRVELGRYTVPVTPLSDRTCLYCNQNASLGLPSNDDESHLDSPPVDDESHFFCYFARHS